MEVPENGISERRTMVVTPSSTEGRSLLGCRVSGHRPGGRTGALCAPPYGENFKTMDGQLEPAQGNRPRPQVAAPQPGGKAPPRPLDYRDATRSVTDRAKPHRAARRPAERPDFFGRHGIEGCKVCGRRQRVRAAGRVPHDGQEGAAVDEDVGDVEDLAADARRIGFQHQPDRGCHVVAVHFGAGAGREPGGRPDRPRTGIAICAAGRGRRGRRRR